MTPWNKRWGYIICLMAFFSPHRAMAQDLYDVAHTQRYAAHLYDTKQYEAAAQEYKNLFRLNTGNDSAIHGIFISYRKSKLYDSTIHFIHRTWPIAERSPLYVKHEYIKSLILSGNYVSAGDFLKQDSGAGFAQKYDLYYYALSGQWKAISPQTLQNLSMTSRNADAWQKLVEKQKHLKYAKPGIALAMSTLVPGSGKFYTHDWKDGVLSFLTVGSLAYESYIGFHARGTKSVLGWVFGGLAVGFYSGNIYGSYTSATRYNKSLDNRIHNEAEKLTISDF